MLRGVVHRASRHGLRSSNIARMHAAVETEGSSRERHDASQAAPQGGPPASACGSHRLVDRTLGAEVYEYALTLGSRPRGIVSLCGVATPSLVAFWPAVKTDGSSARFYKSVSVGPNKKMGEGFCVLLDGRPILTPQRREERYFASLTLASLGRRAENGESRRRRCCTAPQRSLHSQSQWSGRPKVRSSLTRCSRPVPS